MPNFDKMSQKELVAWAKKQEQSKVKNLSFGVSKKGAVSVYGLQRFPVTLYKSQWERLLQVTDKLNDFMEENSDDLTSKGDD